MNVTSPSNLDSPVWGFVTPSYSGDFDRCVLLCRSMDEFLSGPWHHYVIVDKPDHAQFRVLTSPRRTVLLTDDVVPKGMRHLFNMPFLGGRSVWWSRGTGFFVGWHMQQIIKIGIAHFVDQTGLVYCDSDVFFVRPFDVRTMVENGKFRFFKTSGAMNLADHTNPKYMRTGLKILGLPQTGKEAFPAYIDNVVTWHRQTVLALCAELEMKNQLPWHIVVGKRMEISEYMLYGMFVDGIQKSNPHLFEDHQSLCKTHWRRVRLSEKEVQDFCSTLDGRQVAIGIQSFAGVNVEFLKSEFERAASRHARGITEYRGKR